MNFGFVLDDARKAQSHKASRPCRPTASSLTASRGSKPYWIRVSGKSTHLQNATNTHHWSYKNQWLTQGFWTMKTLLSAVALALISHAAYAGNIGGGPHGGMSAGAASPGMMGMQAGPGQHGPGPTGGVAAESQGGQGGRYSVVDSYQPWPEAEMRRFEKPQWQPYAGK